MLRVGFACVGAGVLCAGKRLRAIGEGLRARHSLGFHFFRCAGSGESAPEGLRCLLVKGCAGASGRFPAWAFTVFVGFRMMAVSMGVAG
ncbi:MAG: hypothetical protein HG459_000785 [Bacteroidia bacterium]|nr:hypothetical protein [Bacteroidia bacterium]